MNSYETLIVSIEDRVALIRLNRPEAMNALNALLMSELADCLRACAEDDAVRVIVVTGSDRAFAAGADIREMADKTFGEMFTSEMFAAEYNVLQKCPKPTIAAVAGFALGGGCEIAMACDFIIAADTAKFGQPEVGIGIIPGLGGTQRLTLLIGRAKAMDLNLTGRMMDAAEAERAGLVARVVPAADLITESLKAARMIAEKPGLAVRAAREAINAALELTLAQGMQFEKRLFHSLFATADQKEGMRAFLDKRPPVFRDK